MYGYMNVWMYGLYKYAHNWFTMILEPWHLYMTRLELKGGIPVLDMRQRPAKNCKKSMRKKHGSLQNQKYTIFLNHFKPL